MKPGGADDYWTARFPGVSCQGRDTRSLQPNSKFQNHICTHVTKQYILIILNSSKHYALLEKCASSVFSVFSVFINLSRDFSKFWFSAWISRPSARGGISWARSIFAISLEMALPGRAAADDPINPQLPVRAISSTYMACAGLHALPGSRVVRLTTELRVFLGSAARGVIRGLYSQIVNFRIVYVHM